MGNHYKMLTGAGVKEEKIESKTLAVVAGGRNEALTVFRRRAAPEKIRIVRTGGSNSGGIGAGWLAEVRFLVYLGAFHI